ncbi:hypothetical protein SAMN05421578_1423 [Paenibacillus macquariensis]|uniref:Conjugal transfer protein n=2 Tax=Paenibacillus macquariensis TaxID=948756 RepID=A0ABY1KEI6_9BACL|nr:hypothetical protein SAMN05421578_1423 [Paenibacillus macquariensis]
MVLVLKVRKVTSYVLMILIFLGAIGGLEVIFSNKNNDNKKEYADIQSFAEYVTKLYLTVDPELQSRKDQLRLTAPRMAEVLSVPKNIRQWVQQVKAKEPDKYANDRYSVQVETWTVALKKVVKEGDKNGGLKYTPRRYTVDLDIVGDGSQGYIVSGLPKIKEIPVNIREIEKVESPIDEKLLLPLLNNILPTVFSGNIDEVKNYLSENAEVKLFSGGYEFIKIIDTQIYESDKDEYRILANVKVMDPVTETPIGLKITMDVIRTNDKFYIKNVF